MTTSLIIDRNTLQLLVNWLLFGTVCVVFVLYCVVILVMVGADDTEHRLMRDLLRNYDRRVRPSLNSSEPLNVTFGLALAQIIDVVRVPMFICVSSCACLPLSLSFSVCRCHCV